MLGHTLGAAGAIEAIVTILTIRDGCVPPTINLDDPDPEAAGLDLTPNVAAHASDVRAALSNSFGFGGQNTALDLPAVGRMTDDRPAGDDRARRIDGRRASRRRAAAATPRDRRRRRAARPDRPAGRPARAVRPDRARGRVGRDRRSSCASRSPSPPAARRRGRPRPRAGAAAAGVDAGEPSTAGRDPAPTARPVDQGAADRHLLRVAGARLGAVRRRSAARSPSARSSA